MRTFFRFFFRALILLVVALASALTAMRFAIHVREVAVPDMIGKTPLEARRMAETAGFNLQVERQFYSDKVPSGHVLSQLPPAGTQVRTGWHIRVAESLGPQRTEIPSMLGQSERAAEMNIRRRGLDVGAVAHMQMPGAPADRVLAQSPPPYASGVAAPKINLLITDISQPQAFVMPSFVGQPLASIAFMLQDSGMQMGTATMAAGTVSPGALPSSSPPPSPSQASIVVSQSPAAGEKVLAGTSVKFQVR